MQLDKWSTCSPLEIAVRNEHAGIVNFMLKQIYHQESTKLALLAVSKASMRMIETSINYYYDFLPDMLIQTAQIRNSELYEYLDLKQKSMCAMVLKTKDPIKTFKFMFYHYSSTTNPIEYIPLITKFICAYPEVVVENSLLEELTTQYTKIYPKGHINKYYVLLAVEKICAFMEAIFEAKRKNSNLPFNVEKTNTDNKTPLEIALNHGNNDVTAAIIFYGNPKINSEQQKRIETFILFYCNALAQHHIQLNKAVTPESSRYFKARQNELVEKLKKDKGTLYMLNSLLTFPLVCPDYQFDMTTFISVITDFICTYPETINSTQDNPEGNTPLHQAIMTKNSSVVNGLLCSIFEAGFKECPNFKFDIEQKNHQNKTVLDLALAQGNNEVTSALLLYGNPQKSEAQQNQLIASKIDIPAIYQKRETIFHEIIRKQNRTMEVQHKALTDTIVEVMEIKQVNAQIVRQLEMQQQMLNHFAQLLGFNMNPMNNEVPMQHQQLLQVPPNNRFFVPI